MHKQGQPQLSQVEPGHTEHLRLCREALQTRWQAGSVSPDCYHALSSLADSYCSQVAEIGLNEESVSAERAGLRHEGCFDLKGVERVIQVVEKDDILFISTSRAVRRFDLSGAEQEPLDMAPSRYVGLFPDGERLWVVNANGKSLMAFSWTGEHEMTVPLADIGGVDPEVATPCYGFMHHGKIWLLATKDFSLEATYQRKIYKISLDTLTAEIVETPSGHALGMLSSVHGVPTLLSNSLGTLFEFSEGNGWRPVFLEMLPRYARAVVGWQGKHVMGVGNFMKLYDTTSGACSVINLFRQYGIVDPVLGTSGDHLIVTPKFQPKVHLFSARSPE